MKMKRLAALWLLCCLLLTACAAPERPVIPSATLPPVIDDIVAPVGDAALFYAEDVALYLPSRDGQRLICLYETLTLNHGRHPAETVARALLAHPGNASAAPVGGGVALQLSASDPVELSGEVCTVNLMPSALQLNPADLYAACLCLTTTLCELPGVRSVNVLIAGQAVGLDVAGRLPLGSLSPHVGAELSVLWSQMAARRAPVGSDPATVPLSAAATLYFPLANGDGVVPEVRTIAFDGQETAQLVRALMAALAAGPQRQPDAASLPDLPGLLAEEPVATDLETGGRMVRLRFRPELERALQAAGVSPACFAASVTCTLTTFVPSLASVQLFAGDQPLTSVSGPAMGSLLFPGGVTRRADFTAYINAQTTLYLPGGGHLNAVIRRLPDEEAYHPRTLLLTLFAGPSEAERAAGLTPLMPEGLTDADILGVSFTGDTLLVNFSTRVAERIRESELDQHLMCRGLVGALCELMDARRVRFFFGGDALETLNGPIFWGGEFLYSPSLTDAAGGE